ncbi:MAG TPA: heme A synthase [Bacillales bacterium]|nr:heme A synthase [Bacillales bacterium]
MDRALKGYAVITTIGMLVVVIMGAIVTNTQSADGCGTSWPLCYGHIIPQQANEKTWIEVSHRYVSALLGILVVILAVWSWVRLPRARETKFLAVMSVFFIVLQGLLGGAAVKWQESSFALALHFGFSIISFASVLLLAIVIFEQLHFGQPYTPKMSKGFRTNIFAISIYTYLVVYSGAFVRHSGSASGCGTSWPLCNGQWIPPIATPAGVQFIHRVAAGIVFLWILYIFIKAIPSYSHKRLLFGAVLAAFLLVSAQVAAGAVVVLSGLALPFLLLHALFITCLFGVLCYLFMVATRRKNHRLP